MKRQVCRVAERLVACQEQAQHLVRTFLEEVLEESASEDHIVPIKSLTHAWRWTHSGRTALSWESSIRWRASILLITWLLWGQLGLTSGDDLTFLLRHIPG